MPPISLNPAANPERTAVTVAEAAVIAGRSVSWVRTHINFGPLERADVDGRHGVTIASLTAFLKHHRSSRRPRGSNLTLVVDNTK